MQVMVEVSHRVQHAVNVMRNGKGGGALGVAREGAIEVALVNRRDPGSCHGSRQIGGRQDDDPALDVLGFKLTDQFGQDNLAFVLVAMVAGHQEHGGSGAIANHRDGDGKGAISGAGDRVRQVQPAHLLALAVIVDIGKNQAGIGHGSAPVN